MARRPHERKADEIDPDIETIAADRSRAAASRSDDSVDAAPGSPDAIARDSELTSDRREQEVDLIGDGPNLLPVVDTAGADPLTLG